MVTNDAPGTYSVTIQLPVLAGTTLGANAAVAIDGTPIAAFAPVTIPGTIVGTHTFRIPAAGTLSIEALGGTLEIGPGAIITIQRLA